MRVIEIYEKGDFPKLVLDSKKAFAATYGLQSEYWRHFDIARVARGPQLPEEQPGGPRASLSRAVPGGRPRGGEARELRGGGALVPRLPLLVPERARVARHRLPARRSPAREQELRPCGARVRAHGVRLSRAREGGRGRLRGDLRPPRAREGRDGRGAAGGPARRGGEHAALRREVPEARARRGGARRGGRRPVRDEGVRAARSRPASS